MKRSVLNRRRYVRSGQINLALILVMMVLGVFGCAAMQVGGFAFAPDAGKLFLDKLPVLFLVALLIERTSEIFLTIWRGGASIQMQQQLASLTELYTNKEIRDKRLGALPGLIATGTATLAATTDPAQKAAQALPLAAMEKELVDLGVAKVKEENEMHILESATLANKKPGSMANRDLELADYKNDTRKIAMTFNFILAIMISCCGFRAVEGLVIVNPATPAVQTAPAKTGPELVAKPGTNATEQAASLATAPATNTARSEQREANGFRFFDILLTAGLLAGGADPISRVMKLFRDFMDNKSAKQN